MITVRKANKIVRVIENELDKYLSKGYVIDEASVQKQAPVKTEPKVEKVESVVIKPTQSTEKTVEQPKSRRRKK